MASFLNTDLPSSDEEDDDYKPEADKTAEAEDRAAFLADRKRHRDDEDDDEDDRGRSLLAQDVGYSAQIKKAKIDHLWDLLNSKSKSVPSTPLPASASAGPSGTPATSQPASARTSVGPTSAVNIASLCRTVSAKERKKVNSDALWMRNLGITAPKHQRSSPTGEAAGQGSTQAASQGEAQQGGQGEAQSDDKPASGEGSQHVPGSTPAAGKTEISEDERAMAAAALAAAREGGLTAVRNANKVTITQTRRFAGKDIEVKVQVDKNSKEAAKAAEQAVKPPPKSGLDAFLAEVTKKKKVNVLDKTKADWQQLKASDASLEEELEAHKRSGAQYLDKVGFLKRTELREYEAERDTRLASDVRTRGRL